MTPETNSTGTSVLLVGGPFDDETTVVSFLGPRLVAPCGRQGEAVYRVIWDAIPLRAEFEGFRQRDP